MGKRVPKWSEAPNIYLKLGEQGRGGGRWGGKRGGEFWAET